MPQFKVGDTVRRIKNSNYGINDDGKEWELPVGSVGAVIEVKEPWLRVDFNRKDIPLTEQHSMIYFELVPELNKQPRLHAEVIKAWADGETIQALMGDVWVDISWPTWHPETKYRIKPEPKPDIVKESTFFIDEVSGDLMVKYCSSANVRFIFDGETRKIKSVELIK